MSSELQRPESNCPSANELRDLSTGMLNSPKLQQVLHHLSQCVQCESKLDCIQADYESDFATLRSGDLSTRFWQELEFQQMCARAKDIPRIGPIALMASAPEHIGPYLIIRKLGDGGFATVYLAKDPSRHRLVAIKVPRLSKGNADEAFQLLRREAMLCTELDHPRISQVFDCDRDSAGVCYIAMQYVEGKSLRQVLYGGRISYQRAVKLIIDLSDALQHAHQRRIYHRDVKPKNIIIDTAGNPNLIDFGLAIHERDRWLYENQTAGTNNYMSPEQVRGESHRLDGRTDIWSLGVVFFELLTGKVLFEGTQSQIFDEILYRELSPRSIDAAVPHELERICQKCLSKRISDRYTTALDLAADLRAWLEEKVAGRTTNTRVSTSIAIVPKGLKSFDDQDAEFFLELLPGPRDRTGLPEVVRFWKNRIEATDPDGTFPVGLVYGPSGGGKSSLVKAGLLPRLNESVVTVFVLATSESTESQLLSAMRHRFPDIPESIDLVKLLTDLRSGKYLAQGQKVLIVFDQFEQWLHACPDYDRALLAQALRQCNGIELQALVIVRDDFWMAVTRFFRALEFDLFDGRNSASVDRFELLHARKVLKLFGQAHGALPNTASPTAEQERFLDQALRSIAEEGTVVCVHLALLVEMVKSLPWIPGTLRNASGAEGIGLAFLESKFGRNSNPTHQFHAAAARRVLTMLLPEAGVDIRGSTKSSAELLAASGYSDSNSYFTELIHLLDADLRLIVHADSSATSAQEPARESHYQLTHDFLVPALRKWIHQVKMETRRGRAELILDQRTRMWQTHKEDRQLPSLQEWAGIRILTSSVKWSNSQRQMMRRAGWIHGMRWGAAAALVGALMVGIFARDQANNLKQAELLVDQIILASADGVPYAIQTLEPLRKYAVPILNQRFNSSNAGQMERLHAAVAMAEFGNVQLDFLVSNIAGAASGECANIVSALSHNREASLKLLREHSKAAASTQQWDHKARLAVVALHLGDAAIAHEMFRLRPDPVERTVLVDTIADWHGSILQLLQSGQASNDAAFCSGICLGVGNISIANLPANKVNELGSILSDWFRNKPDGVTHSASSWVLRRWKLTESIELSPKPDNECQWIVNSIDMTMLTIPAGEFVRLLEDNSNPTAVKRCQQTVSLTSAFLISDREVSCRQFQTFIDDGAYPQDLKPQDWKGVDLARSSSLDHPVQNTSWFEAVQFCNWLSAREGLLPAYQLNGSNVDSIANSDGYRLPLESEWEYVCRAGTTTDFSSGNDESRLKNYAVYQSNRTDICGAKMPNGWGVFDLHGNVYEWCQDWWEKNRAPIEHLIDPAGPQIGLRRVLRGGAFDYDSSKANVNDRIVSNRPGYRSYTIGFRLVRTIR